MQATVKDLGRVSNAENTAIEPPIDHSLQRFTLTPTKELEVEYAFCDSNETLGRSALASEARLRSPVPYVSRQAHFAASAPLLVQCILPRARSSSPRSRAPDAPRGRELRNARVMAQSMPNLFSSRSMHNRSVGYCMLSLASESGDAKGAKESRERVKDFEALLEGL